MSHIMVQETLGRQGLRLESKDSKVLAEVRSPDGTVIPH